MRFQFRRHLRMRADDFDGMPELPTPPAVIPATGSADMVGELVRQGTHVDLRRHLPAHRDPFIAWYADPEIAEMLRHDLTPLEETRARSYFNSIILPASARGTCWAIHLHDSGELIGSTAVTDVDLRAGTSLFRLVIGNKSAWGHGYGTEATRLVLAEAFEVIGLQQVNLEVFTHNPRARRAYEKVGFRQTGEHSEWVGPLQRRIEIMEMALNRRDWVEG